MSFKRLDPEDITISADSITAPTWTNQTTTLTSFVTSSNQVASTAGLYYYEIYQTSSNLPQAVVQFALAYGNRKGSGSVDIGSQVGKSPSAVTYGQYRTLINGDENTDFKFNISEPDSIYVISVNRGRYKEKLRSGTTTLTLVSGSASITLTDNSKTDTAVSYVDAGRVFELVSGSGGVVYTGSNSFGFTATSASYGKIYPDVGILILNGDALKLSEANGGLGLVLNEASNSASPSNLQIGYNILSSFSQQSEETVTSNYVFVRVRNSEYNYTTNPSNITGSGELRYDVMVNSPQAYITTVGMYNDNNELLGVAKLSRPLLKDFTKEALIRIKLDY